MSGRISRREVFRTGAAAGVAAALTGAGAGSAGAAPPGGSADDGTVTLVNGKIHTMDADNTVAKAVAIRNGRIVSVGDSAANPGPGGKVINLHGRTVVPGVIDNHNHIVLMGNRPGYHTPLENAYSIADIQQIYAARAAGIPAGAWITTIGGFHINHFVASNETPR
ncbi:MAG TPA: amidohydrolase family protein, partial [Jiangellaceae bacterium]